MTTAKRIRSALDQAAAIGIGSVLILGTLVSLFDFSIFKGTDESATVVPAKTPPHKDIRLMQLVLKVNGDASTLMLSPYFSLAMDELAPCLLANHASASKGMDDPIIVKLVMQYKNECDFTAFSRNLTLPVFEKIAATHSLPTTPYAFDAFHGDLWALVGLFETLESCNVAREEAARRSIGTRVCGSWQPRY